MSSEETKDSVSEIIPEIEKELNRNEPIKELNVEQELEKLMELPEVVEDAIQASQDETKNNDGIDYSHYKDRDGNAFNKGYHETTPDGKPVLTKDGKLRKKRGRSNLKIPIEDKKAQIDEQRNRRNISELTVACFLQVGIAIFGDEWKPELDLKQGIDEKGNLVDVTDDYYKVVGVANLPPWAAIIIAYGSYGIKRLPKPNTQSKTKIIWGKVKNGFGRMFKNIRKNKGVKNARVDSRDNGNGKDNKSETVISNVQGKRN